MFSSMREAAETYLSLGLNVVPLRPLSKVPSIPSLSALFRRKITNEELILFDRPETNIGIICGGISGNLVVLDLDDNSTLRSIMRTFPTAPAVLTGRGGHVYIKTDEPVRTYPLTGGHHIKGEGSYVVAPPSKHPSGKQYIWHSLGGDIGNIPLVSQDELINVLQSEGLSVRKAEVRLYESDWVKFLLANHPEGERNTAITRIAGYLRRYIPDEEVVIGLLRVYNEARCDPPIDDKELVNVVRGIYRRYKK
ncbi:MAG: bifunctional DNA primase/polymerase [Candidatus Caldarchaeum sp.]